nr:MAG TPA: hypothetical protein [Caudoviricetes sp.]
MLDKFKFCDIMYNTKLKSSKRFNDHPHEGI